MTESTEARTTICPQWLELSLEEMVRHTYWTTMGSYPTVRRKWWQRAPSTMSKGDQWLTLFHSKEEAEAHAVMHHPTGWMWDKKAAEARRLSDSIFEARRDGNAGVQILGWKDGSWIILRVFWADVPLPGVE